MRIFVAGATGVIGARLLPLLVEAGHTVGGMTRSPQKARLVEELGATPVVCDVFDTTALGDAVRACAPELILHELTDLPDDRADLPASRSANARIRREGTRNLIEAATAAGCDRLVAQSVAWEMPPGDGADAVALLESSVLAFGGVVLRYGQFYGPDTVYPDDLPDEPRVHIDTAVRRTLTTLDAPSGVVTIVDE